MIYTSALALGLSLCLSVSACTPFKKKNDAEAQSKTKNDAVSEAAGATALTKSPETLSPLIGSWSACETSSSETLQISGITHYQIKDEQNMTVSFRYFSDTECKIPFNEADATKAIKAWETFYKEKAQDDVKDYYQSLINGFSQDSNYVASKVNPGDVGSFDQTTNFETAYLSYKILEGKLYITEACLPTEIVVASEKNCTIKGEFPENRSTDFLGVVPFDRM